MRVLLNGRRARYLSRAARVDLFVSKKKKRARSHPAPKRSRPGRPPAWGSGQALLLDVGKPF